MSMESSARPSGTEYAERGSYVAPQWGAQADQLDPNTQIDMGQKYGSSYEATLNSSTGRETMSSPGLESIPYMDTEKETYRPAQSGPAVTIPEQERRRFCGLPLWLLITLLVVLIALAVGLGVGLGVGLHRLVFSTLSASGAPIKRKLIVQAPNHRIQCLLQARLRPGRHPLRRQTHNTTPPQEPSTALALRSLPRALAKSPMGPW